MSISIQFSVAPALAVLISITPAPSKAEEWYDRSEFIAGVQIRPNTIKDDDFKEISDVGFNAIRMGVRLEYVENGKQSQNWSLYDSLFKLASQHNLIIIATLFDGEAAANPKKRSPAWVRKFSQFAADATKRYNGNNKVIWEIWNEPNGKTYWSSVPDPKAYSRLVESTCQSMRITDPSVNVLAGALGTDTNEIPYDPFIKLMLPLVHEGCIDGISIHPYRQVAPETVSKTLSDLRQRYPGVQFEITEWGYTAAGRAYSPSTARNWASRIPQASWRAGSNIAVIYEWKSGRTAPKDREENFGILNADGRETETYYYLKNILNKLKR